MHVTRIALVTCMVASLAWLAVGFAAVMWGVRSPDHPAYAPHRTKAGGMHQSSRGQVVASAVLLYGGAAFFVGYMLRDVLRRDRVLQLVGALGFAACMLVALAGLALSAWRGRAWSLIYESPREATVRAAWFALCAAVATVHVLRVRRAARG